MLTAQAAPPLTPGQVEGLVQNLELLCGRRPVRLCYLYGSYARGTPTALSDLDVGFLLDLPDRKARWKLWGDLYHEVSFFCPDHEVDLVVLNDVGPILRNKIIRDGRLVYQKDARTRVDFECQTLKAYFDFKPYADVYDRALFDCIKGGEFGGRCRDRSHAVEQAEGFGAPSG